MTSPHKNGVGHTSINNDILLVFCRVVDSICCPSNLHYGGSTATRFISMNTKVIPVM